MSPTGPNASAVLSMRPILPPNTSAFKLRAMAFAGARMDVEVASPDQALTETAALTTKICLVTLAPADKGISVSFPTDPNSGGKPQVLRNIGDCAEGIGKAEMVKST